jgi:integrase
VCEEIKVASNGVWGNIKPFRKLDLPKVRFLTMDEVNAFIPACETTFQILVKAALLTGCRCGELTAMKINTFDARQGTAYVAESKNGESRCLELNFAGVALLPS